MADLETSHATLDHTGITGAGTPQALATTDSPQFAGVNVGHASDTTVTRSAAGDIQVEGNRVFRVGGADVPVADGGTGASSASAARTNLGALGDTDAFTYLDATEAAAPSTPSTGKVRIYAKSDGRVYSKDDAGVEYGPFDAAGGGAGDHELTAITSNSYTAGGGGYVSVASSVVASVAGLVAWRCNVTGGTGSNTMGFRINGSNTGITGIPTPGFFGAVTAVSAGDTVEPIILNSAGNGMTINTASWTHPVP